MNKFQRLVRFGVVLAALVSIAVLLPSPLHAQTFFGSVVGTVTDTSGAVVPGATVTERTNVQFRAEFFHLFNHKQWAPPDSSYTDPQWGMIVATANNPRPIQLSLHVNF